MSESAFDCGWRSGLEENVQHFQSDTNTVTLYIMILDESDASRRKVLRMAEGGFREEVSVAADGVQTHLE